MTVTTQRPIETICPPWCEGHAGHYQDWEERVVDGKYQRDHAATMLTVVPEDGAAHAVNVGVCRTEDRDSGAFGAAYVTLYVESDGADLTPDQAVHIAATLLAQAEAARAEMRELP